MRTGLMAAGMALMLGCSSGKDTEPMAGQLARINRDLAVLIERVDALERRMDQSGQGSAAVDVAAPGPAAAASSPAPTLTVDIGETLQIDGKTVSTSELAERFRQHAAAAADAAVVLRAQPSVPQGRVVEIIDLAKEAGIERFSLSTGETPTAVP